MRRLQGVLGGVRQVFLGSVRGCVSGDQERDDNLSQVLSRSDIRSEETGSHQLRDELKLTTVLL